MKTFTSVSQKRGELGESIAVKYLEQRGFSILERNHTRRIGEIDIIAQKGGMTHFVEVKAVSRESVDDISPETGAVRPEDQMHGHKIERLRRTIAAYLGDGNIRLWQFDLACVYIDEKRKRAKVKMMEDLIL